jgi:hypothetical protein
MKVSEMAYGATHTITLKVMGGNASNRGTQVRDEVTLRTSRANGRALLSAGGDAWWVEGAEPADQDVLDVVTDTGLPCISWVTQVGRDRTVVVRVHRFAHRLRWEHEIVIGIDDDSLRSAQRVLGGRRSADQLKGWLENQFLIPAGPDRSRPPRVLASAGQQAMTLDKGFSLLGTRAVAHIENLDGRLRLKTLRWAGNRERQAIALTLVEAEVAFRDSTEAMAFRERHRDEFAQLLSTGQQYLNHWDDYSEREREQIVRGALGLGAAKYTQVRQVEKRTFRFHLAPEGAQEFLARLGDGSIQLEAAAQAPDGLRDGRLELDDKQPDSVFTGSIAQIGVAAGTIALRVPDDHEITPPPSEGDLYLSLAGDRVRIRRQRRARRKIESLSTPMPQLGLLLEGQPVQSGNIPARIIQPRDLPAFAPYRNFTSKQEEAVRIAINTPDIALIQGPPGTGKTSVITAIEQCLVQLGKEAGNVGQSVLVTSFQHNAVEEVVRRTEVLGLPAVKIGAKAREESSRNVQLWCARKIEELKRQLPPEGQLLRATRTVEALVIGYSRQPPQPGRTAELIAQIEQLAGPYLPASVKVRLIRARTDLTAETRRPRIAAAELEPLRRSIAAVRTHPVAFADDGPHMARKALLRLSAQGGFTDADLAPLAEAAGFDGQGPPQFLERLARSRERLLDLTAPVTVLVDTVADEELVRLFSDVVGALRDRVARSADGPAAAIAEFLDELEHDPDGTADAIRHFTAVIAATCQQSASGAMADALDGNNILFDTVIVDEAARANPLDLMIPLCLAARRIILVGDHRQLPHLLEPDIERELESSEEDEMLHAVRQSMFERLFNYLRAAKPEDGFVKREITLDTQFRMHHVLGEFVSSAFYADDTKLVPGPGTHALHHGIERYGDAVAVWADLSLGRHGGETAGRSKSRPAEADWIADELERLIGEVPADRDFGVITFYRAQVQAIWSALKRKRLADRGADGQYQPAGTLAGRFHVGTVDEFQGREFDIVLLSVTRSNTLPGGQSQRNRRKYGHLMLANRLCVAMSRQKRLLIAVGDAAMFTRSATGGEVRGLVMFRELCEDERYGRVVPA